MFVVEQARGRYYLQSGATSVKQFVCSLSLSLLLSVFLFLSLSLSLCLSLSLLLSVSLSLSLALSLSLSLFLSLLIYLSTSPVPPPGWTPLNPLLSPNKEYNLGLISANTPQQHPRLIGWPSPVTTKQFQYLVIILFRFYANIDYINRALFSYLQG